MAEARLMKHIDLCSGIGGFALAARWAGCETIQFVEIESFCQNVLAKNFPGVPIHADLRAFSGEPFRGRVDLLTAGFPCQDVSVAGKRAGLHGSRSSLWFDVLRVIRECEARVCVIENSPNLRSNGADIVLGGMEEAGYTCWPFVVGADNVGAPHRRKRVWIVAYSNSGSDLPGPEQRQSKSEELREPAHCLGTMGYASQRENYLREPGGLAETSDRRERSDAAPCDASTVVAVTACREHNGQVHSRRGRAGHSDGSISMANPNGSGRREQCRAFSVRPQQPTAECMREDLADSETRGLRCQRRLEQEFASCLKGFPPGPQGDWSSIDPDYYPVELAVRGAADGIPERLVRRQLGSRAAILRGLGNAVVPQVAYCVIKAALEGAR